ncbi:MAG: M23 family metallopeptidase [Treponema sp.]|nr:M23 family metallopeptidase [Treponema sp.]MCL2237422.1 M23 family metallopeptidase [Treponema sp.]
MKKHFVFVLLALFLIFDSLLAMNWPSDNNAVLIRNFGANDRGKPVLGMIFGGGEQVLAAESGEIIFSRAKNDPASRLPSPLGAWTAIDHGDGLISIYSRYADTDAENRSRNVLAVQYIEKQQPIAFSGASGWSTRNGFYYMLFDRRERRWINPAMIITPALETRSPSIVSVDLRNADGVLMQSRNLTQGRYTVVVNAAGGTPSASSPAGLQPFAPQRIVCSINGAEVGSLNFEAVSARDGILMVSRNGLVPAKQIYAAYPTFEAAEVFLTRGQINLEVIVQDITGGSRSFTTRLIVN